MRANQFIFEYRRDKTAQNFKDGIIDAVLSDTSLLRYIGEGVYNIVPLLRYFEHPELLRQPSRVVDLKILGQDYSFSADTINDVVNQVIPRVVDRILQYLESADPSPNKQYTPWLAKIYADRQASMEDITSTGAEYLNKFYLLNRKRMIPSPKNDIMRYNSIDDLYNMLDDMPDPAEFSANRGDATEIFSDSDVRVIVPKDEAAACYYGRGTRWCTAATRAENYFAHYNADGELFILLPKNPEYDGEKYQLHFESDQYMNEKDVRVSLSYLFIKRFPSLLPFFLKREPLIKAYICFANDSTIEEIYSATKPYFMDFLVDYLSLVDQVDYTRELLYDRGFKDSEGNFDWDRIEREDVDFLHTAESKRIFDIAVEIIQMPAHEVKRQAINAEQIYTDQVDVTKRIVPLIDIFWLMRELINKRLGTGSSLANDLINRLRLDPPERGGNKHWGVRKIR